MAYQPQSAFRKQEITYILKIWHHLSWSPYGIGQAIIFSCRGFYLLFPHLISAAAQWMSTILPHWCGLSANLECMSEMCGTRLAKNTGPKKVAKNPHLGTNAPHNFVGLYLCNQGTYRQSEKKLVKQQYVLQMFPQCGELRPTNGWDRFGSLRHPQLISMGFASWQRYCTAVKWWASAKLCGIEQRMPPMFGRATITLGIGPHI